MTGGRKNILAGWKNCNVEDGMMSDCNNYKNRRVEYSANFFLKQHNYYNHLKLINQHLIYFCKNLLQNHKRKSNKKVYVFESIIKKNCIYL